MTKKKGSNKQNHGPREKEGDPNFKMAVKTLYHLIQVLHHLAICLSQQEGKLTKGFQAKLSELNRWLKPACSTSKLKQELEIAHGLWVTGVTEALITHYKERIAEFTKHLKSCSLNFQDFEKAQDLATSWARKNFRKKLTDKTLAEFRKICKDSMMRTAPNARRSSSSSVPTAAPKPSTSGLGTSTPNKRKMANSPAKSPNSQVSPPKKLAKMASPRANSVPMGTCASDQMKAPISTPKASYKPWVADRGQQKQNWSFPKLSAPTLIIGASNLSNITKSRVPKKDLDVCSFPGAKMFTFMKLFERTSPQTHVKKVLLNLGINDRGNSVRTTSLPQFHKVLQATRKVFPNARIFLSSLQWDPKRISNSENANLEALHEGFKSAEGIDLIPKLASEKFKIAPEDKYGIHWTKESANQMLDHWLHHLN